MFPLLSEPVDCYWSRGRPYRQIIRHWNSSLPHSASLRFPQSIITNPFVGITCNHSTEDFHFLFLFLPSRTHLLVWSCLHHKAHNETSGFGTFFFIFPLYFFFSLAFIIGRPTGVISAWTDCWWLGFCCGIAFIHPHSPQPACLFPIDPRTHTCTHTHTHTHTHELQNPKGTLSYIRLIQNAKYLVQILYV
jgi:hypothetical protein